MERGLTRAREWAPAALCGALTLAITLWQLGRPSYWLDEAATIDVSGRSLPQMFQTLLNVDAVHGLYYLFIHFWRQLFGISEFALRFPSAVAMAVAAIGLVRLGQRLGNTRMAVIAAFIFALNVTISYFAEEARPYAMVVAVAVWASLALERVLDKPSRRRWWAYGVLVGLLGALNFFALLLVPAHAIRVVLRHLPIGAREFATSRILRAWLLTVLGAGLVISAILVADISESGQIDWIPKPKADALRHFANFLSGSWTLTLILFPLAILGLWWGTRALRELATPWLVLPITVLLTASLFHPIYIPRYVLFSQPALCLLAAAGLEGLIAVRHRVLRWATSACAVGLALAIAFLSFQGLRLDHREASKLDDLRAAAHYLSAHEQPGDGIYYLRNLSRMAGAAYPGPFQRLEDVILVPGGSPLERRDLYGVDYNILHSPAERLAVTDRFERLNRVWVQRDRTAQWLLRRDRRALAILRNLGFVRMGPTFYYRGGSLTLWIRKKS